MMQQLFLVRVRAGRSRPIHESRRPSVTGPTPPSRFSRARASEARAVVERGAERVRAQGRAPPPFKMQR